MISLSARALELLLRDWRGSAPAYTALADRIRLLVLDGRIPLGARLPAERDLAARLELSRTTISATYAELRASGYLHSVRGSGSVARLPGREPTETPTGTAGYLDFGKAALPAVPQLAEAAVRAARALPAHFDGTGFDLIGLPALRRAIADRYLERGLPTDPEQIMVTIGAQHAIALLSRVLLARGDSALVEAPSYPHAYEALRGAGGRLVPVSVTTDDGWDDASLEQVLQRTSPAVGYVMPDFHNPTGMVMPAEQRERMLALAARQGTTMIVDETMAELGFDVDALLPPTASFGAAVSIGSLGKTVWGGVRIGWIRAERPLIQRLVRARSAGDLGTPILEQLIAVELLADYAQILRDRRAQLVRGRDHLEAALAAAIPEWSVPHVHGGLTAWVQLGAPVSSQLTLAARGEGLLLGSGALFGIDGAFERYLRVPFSYSAEETDLAVAALARAWASLARHPLSEQQFYAEVV